MANQMRKLMSIYKENELYFKLGTIQENESNQDIFESKEKINGINEFLKQARSEAFPFEETIQSMQGVI